LPNIVTNKRNITGEFIKHIENNIFNLDKRTKKSIRKDIIPVLNRIKYSSPNSLVDSKIKQGLKELNVFLKNNPGLLIKQTKATPL